jgi:hypothetical protein
VIVIAGRVKVDTMRDPLVSVVVMRIALAVVALLVVVVVLLTLSLLPPSAELTAKSKRPIVILQKAPD